MIASPRSPFLDGALAWVYRGDVADRCARCGFEWAADVSAAFGHIVVAPARYVALLDGRDGMSPAADGGWNATAYVWHLVDLVRCWSERWVQVTSMPGSLLVGFDPDVLAEARNYRSLPTVSALWAITDATDRFVTLSENLDPDTTFLHGDWGPGTVADATRWLAHEFVHHERDVDERATSGPRG